MKSTDEVDVANDGEPSGMENNGVHQTPLPTKATRKVFIFDRLLHAITGDNPSISCMPHAHSSATVPRHHHQGHRLDSIMSTQHEESSHVCSVDCSPHCSLRQEDQQPQHKHDPSNKNTRGSRHQSQNSASSAFSWSNMFAPTCQPQLHDKSNNKTESNDEKKSPKTFSPFLFYSKRQSSRPSNSSTITRCTKDPLLYGTSNDDQHEAVIMTALHVCDLYHRGFDMSTMNRCNESDIAASSDVLQSNSADSEGVGNEPKDVDGGHFHSGFDHRAKNALRSLGFEFRLEECQKCSQKHNDSADSTENCKGDNECEYIRCPNCVTRLYHVPSGIAVSKDNRKQFIADGKMYDAIADLCQEVAQEIMAEICDLVWVTVCDGGRGNDLAGQNGHHAPQSTSTSNGCSIPIQNPIRALVGRKQHDVEYDHHPHDTFLISTGNGKVRAGIFSRYHLLTTGLDQSTALPLLCEARSRGMNCVVIDPNARGDGFDVSIRRLFEEQGSLLEKDAQLRTSGIIPADDVHGSVYVLAHSAAGGQLVRYLLNQQQLDAPLLPRIRCITFTDSTHSVQWVKNHPNISSLIQSSKSLYVKSANPMRDDNWENAAPGDVCPRDHFWSHRFGSIKTVWAGKLSIL
jgi:hypothetical protein